MLDLRRIREDPEPARAALARRGAADALDAVLALDARRRELLPRIESGRARRNRVSEAIAEAKRAGSDAEAQIAEMRALGGDLKGLDAELAEVEVVARLEAERRTVANLAERHGVLVGVALGGGRIGQVREARCEEIGRASCRERV